MGTSAFNKTLFTEKDRRLDLVHWPWFANPYKIKDKVYRIKFIR